MKIQSEFTWKKSLDIILNVIEGKKAEPVTEDKAWSNSPAVNEILARQEENAAKMLLEQTLGKRIEKQVIETISQEKRSGGLLGK